MKGLTIAGVLWLVAAAFAVAVTLSFRTDPVEWVVTMALGVVVAILGLWLIARSSALAASASNVISVVWTVLYAVLTLHQFGDLAAWTTNVVLIAIGAAAGLVAFRVTVGPRGTR